MAREIQPSAAVSVDELEAQLEADRRQLKEIEEQLKESRLQKSNRGQEIDQELAQLSAQEEAKRRELEYERELAEKEELVLSEDADFLLPLGFDASALQEVLQMRSTIAQLKKEVHKAQALFSKNVEVERESWKLRNQHAEGEVRLLKEELAQLNKVSTTEEDLSSEEAKAVELSSLKQLEQTKLELTKKLEALEGSTVAEDGISNACSEINSACSSGPPSRGSASPPAKCRMPLPPAPAAPSTAGSSNGASEASAPSLGAKGKGKGKGKPPPPKAPAAGAKAKAKSTAKAGFVVPKKGNLVSLHWKVHNVVPANVASAEDPFFKQTAELLTLDAAAAALAGQREKSQQQSEVQTVFQTPVEEVADLPKSMLEVYFKRREAAVLIDAQQEMRTGLIDDKRMQMLGILLRKYLMANKGKTEKDAVFNIKRAVLRCDYEVVKTEGIGVIRIVLRQQAMDGNKIAEYVKTHGEAALQKLPQPWHHCLVHELLKVPQIDERLECMLFQTSFQETKDHCTSNLENLAKALKLLEQKKPLLRKFFTIAHRLGQSLNQDSRAPQAQRGFQLTSGIDKLVATKCPAAPELNMLHFVLALMSPEDSAAMFVHEERKLLARVKAMKSRTVYQDCTELCQNFQGLQEICDTGKFKSSFTGAMVKMERRRKTMAPGAPRDSDDEEEATLDSDDLFHEKMKAFVKAEEGDVGKIGKACHALFSKYKDLAIFFDDLHSVYPPPRDEKDGKVDLMAVISNLAEHVKTHLKVVEQEGLRQRLHDLRALEAEESSTEPLNTTPVWSQE
eukprot:TRINITY_DN29501_c0_g1_i1.p1 TRINITY_DN29501_c0_g1~~TRINITY_DN29501_c0_g1_i1.p1  ORF type:complete len:791 (+),score=216.56 TRINITY_DN29501_c0_g1_i1:88-2460(+)